jgi:hypothetical protein
MTGATDDRSRTRALPLAGLLVALVLTSALPAWAGAVSARPDQPASACAQDTAGAGETTETGRC